LLQGTGLQAVRDPGGEYTLRKAPAAPASGGTLGEVRVAAPALPTVTVTARGDLAGALPAPHAGGQVARGGRMGLMGNKDLMDTPFSLNAYTSELVANQQARQLVDVIANDPAVQLGGPRSFDNFYIRGFALSREEIGFDGLYGIASAEGNLLEGIERVEVLKGPSTLLNGGAPRGTAGGAINLVPKRAGDTALTRLTATHLGDGNLGAHLDLGRRFGEDQALGVRLNAAWRDGDVAAKNESEDVKNLALGLDWRSARARLSADLGTSEQHLDRARGVFFVTAPSLPAAPGGDVNVWPDWTFQHKEHRFGVVRGEFDLSDSLTASLAVGSSTSQRRMLEAFAVLSGADGTLDPSASGFDERNQRDSLDANLRWRFGTGSVGHEVVLAATHFRADVKTFFPTINYAFTSNLYNPAVVASPGDGLLDGVRVQQSKTRLDSVALADTLSLLDDRLLLTVGARHQKIRADAHHWLTGDFERRYERSRTSPALAVVFKPNDRLSYYANYVEALSQGAVAPTIALNANEVFPPFVSKQGEVGVKVDWGRLTTTLSAFEIRRPSGLLNASGWYTQDGEQRNRGLELQVFGELQPRWRVLGGLTFTDAKLSRTESGLNDGRQAAGVPRWQLKLGSEWDLAAAPGLTLTGRVIHSSAQPLTVDDAIRVPAWTRLDLGARYTTRLDGRPLVLRAALENATDRRYWDSVAAFQVITYAMPRTLMLSATMDF
jgi:iron complex outermembrane receptor protein